MFNYTPKPSVSARRIYPFPDEHPDTFVEIRKVPDVDVCRVYDKHKVFPGAKNQSMSRMTKVIDEIRKLSVINWSGWSLGGDELPFSEENKPKFFQMLDDIRVESESEEGEADTVSLWSHISRLFAGEEDRDRKN